MHGALADTFWAVRSLITGEYNFLAFAALKQYLADKEYAKV
jgi:hypothetical protein